MTNADESESGDELKASHEPGDTRAQTQNREVRAAQARARMEHVALDFDTLEELAGSLDVAQVNAMLGDGRAMVRANGLRALAVMQAPNPAMVPLLCDGEAAVAHAAVASLARLGAAVVAWIPAISEAADRARPSVREQMLLMLSRLVGTADDAFIEALDIVPDRVSDAVVEVLVRAGRPGALLLGRALLTQDKTFVRYNSAKALSRLAQAGVFATLGVDQNIVESLATVRDTDDASDVRAAADDALAAIIAAARIHAVRRAEKAAADAAHITLPGFAERVMSIEELAGSVTVADKDRLVAALHDGRDVVRANAARALAGLGAERAGDTVPAIAVLLRDGRRAVRHAAVDALAWLGRASLPAADALVTSLGDRDPEIRRSAGDALRALGQGAQLALARGLHVESREHGMRVLECVCALANAEELLCRAFAGPSVSAQVNAALGLGLLGRERVGAGLRALEAARTGGDPATREAVHDALAMLAPPEPPGPPAIDVPGFGERLLAVGEITDAAGETSPDPVTNAAGETSPDAATKPAAIGHASLMAALSDGRPYARANAAIFLAERAAREGTEAAVARALKVLVRDSEPVVRAAAARGLGRLGVAAGSQAGALVHALGDRDARVARAARDALSALGEHAMPGLAHGLETDERERAEHVLELLSRLPGAADNLADWFATGSDNRRVNAALGLARLGRERAGAGLALLEAARTSASRRVRTAVADALAVLAPADHTGQAGPPTIDIPGFNDRLLAAGDMDVSAIDPASLKAALGDGNTITRANAATALGTLGPRAADATRLLAVLLRDSDAAVAMASARALTAMGPALGEHISTIARAAADADAAVRDTVIELLTGLVGQIDDMFLSALDAPLDNGQDTVVEALLRAGPPGAMVLARALSEGKTLQRYHSAIAVERSARRGVLLEPDVERTILRALEQVRDTDDATDVREAAGAAIAAVIAGRTSEAVKLAEEAARAAAELPIPGLAERPMSIEELRASVSEKHKSRLVVALGDGYEIVRRNAAHALASLGASKAGDTVRPISVLLRDTQTPVRRAAASALSWFGQASLPVADALVVALGDTDPVVCRAAEDALRAMGMQALPALERGMTVDSRAHADRVIACVNQLPDPERVLCRVFSGPSATAQVNAALGLGRLGRERVGDGKRILEAARTSGDPVTRAAVRVALAMLAPPEPPGPPAIVVPGFGERLLAVADADVSTIAPASLIAAMSDVRPHARANAATFLAAMCVGRSGDHAAGQSGDHTADQAASRSSDISETQVATALAVLMRDGDPMVRAAAAGALGQLGGGAAQQVDVLVRALGDQSPVVVQVARDSLSALGTEALPAITRGLETDEREYAERLLSLVLAAPEPAERLAQWFTSGSDNLRVNAALGMTMLGAERVGAGRSLLEAARTSASRRVRTAVRDALRVLTPAHHQGPPPVDTIPGFAERLLTADEIDLAHVQAASLSAALGDGNTVVRANAATALAKLGARAGDATRLLAVLLRDSDIHVAMASARALATMGTAIRGRISTIALASSSAHPAVRERVLELLSSLVGQDDEALLQALGAPLHHGQDTVVEALLRAGPDGALILARALAEGDTLQRFHSATAIEDSARRGVLLQPDVERTVLRALGDVRDTDEAPDIREAASAAIAAVIAARLGESVRLADRAARRAADIRIPGFAERALSPAELRAHTSDAGPAQMLLALRDGREMVRVNATNALVEMRSTASPVGAANAAGTKNTDDTAGPRSPGQGAGPDDAVRPISVLLRDSQVSVRRVAADALARLGPAALPVADALVHALGDSDPQVTRRAMDALNALGHDAQPALVRGLGVDSRAHADKLLACLGAHADAEDVLCQVFSSPSVSVQVNAALGLGLLGHERVSRGRRLLLAARTGGDAATREAVREALAMLAPPEPPGPPPVDDIPGFTERLLAVADVDASTIARASLLAAMSDSRPYVRANAATFLAVLDKAANANANANAGAGAGSHPLMVLMRDDDALVRIAAARALGTLADAAADSAGDSVGALVHALGDRDVGVVQAARHSLSSLGTAAVPGLAQGMDTDEPDHANRLLELVLALPEAPRFLADWFAAGSDNTRVNAARGLARLGPARVGAARSLLEAARTSGSRRVRSAVRDALAVLAPPQPAGPPAIEVPGFAERLLGADDIDLATIAPASLTAALGDGNTLVRANAATALAAAVHKTGGAVYTHDNGAIRLLAVLLRDSELDVAMSSARALAAMGPAISEHIPTIARAAENARPSVREQVIALFIGLLAGQDDNQDENRDVGRDDSGLPNGLLNALGAPLHSGQDIVVEALLRAGAPGARVLTRALTEGEILQRFHGATAVERSARRGVLLAPDIERTVIQALQHVCATTDAPDIRTSASAAIAAVIAARLDQATRAADRAARQAADLPIPGFAERSLTTQELTSLVTPEHTSRLVTALRDGHAVVRANAARALAVLGPEHAGHAARPIAVLLRDSERPVQRAAAHALHALGDAARPVAHALVAALSIDDADVFRPATDALRTLGEHAREPLLAGLDTDAPDHATRIIDCIRALRDPEDALCQAFSSPLVNVQVNAALGLGALGQASGRASTSLDQGLSLLEAARTGGDARTRAAVRQALDMLAPPAPDAPPAITIPGFDERLLSAQDIGKDIAKDIANRAATISVASVLAALSDGRALVRANGATLFGALGERIAPELHTLAVLLRDSDPCVRRAAANALARLGDHALDVVDALVATLGDPDIDVAEAASSALAKLGDRATSALIRGLDTDQQAQADRLIALMTPRKDAARLFFEAFKSTAALHVQINAAHGLAALGRQHVSDDIIDAFDDEQWFGDLRKRRAVRRALNAFIGPAVAT